MQSNNAHPQLTSPSMEQEQKDNDNGVVLIDRTENDINNMNKEETKKICGEEDEYEAAITTTTTKSNIPHSSSSSLPGISSSKSSGGTSPKYKKRKEEGGQELETNNDAADKCFHGNKNNDNENHHESNKNKNNNDESSITIISEEMNTSAIITTTVVASPAKESAAAAAAAVLNVQAPLAIIQPTTIQSTQLNDMMIMACGNCILCRMPKCERCYLCVMAKENDDEEEEDEEEENENKNEDTSAHLSPLEEEGGGKKKKQKRKKELQACCIRKMCCEIPMEYKLQPLECCGFPTGWRFAFDNPQPRLLVHGQNNTTSRSATFFVPPPFPSLVLPGLKLVSPSGHVYQSLECAFANAIATKESGVATSSAMIISLVSQFMAHIGSSRYEEITDHFLIGRQYCAAFYSNDKDAVITNSNIALFGKIVACMGPATSSTTSNNFHPPPFSSPSSRTRANKRKKEQQTKVKKMETTKILSKNLIFIVQYDSEILHHLSKSRNIEIPQIQFIPSHLAWGGCILYERKTCIRRDASTSVIQNIDRATSVETWIVPDMRIEEMVEHSVMVSSSDEEGEKEVEANKTMTLRLPQLTVYTRGYKFVFRIRDADAGFLPDGHRRQQYGVFVSCTKMPQQQGIGDSGDQEINLKPGELIDLGIVSPLPENEELDRRCCSRKPLSSFLVKNFIHQFRPGEYAVPSEDGNSVYDLTNDPSGQLKDAATKRVLSYIRRKSTASSAVTGHRQQPHHHSSIHIRLDPCGNVHVLFGIQYNGDWTTYENGMQQHFVPIFCGGEVEVTATSNVPFGIGSRDVMEARYLQSISAFSIEEVVSCSEQVRQIIDADANLNQLYPSILLERCEQVVKCLLDRIDKLRSMAVLANGRMTDGSEFRDNNINVNFKVDDPTNSLLLPAINHLNKVAEVMKRRNE